MKGVELSVGFGQGMGEIGHIGEVGPDFGWAQHVFPVATGQDKIMDLARVDRTKKARDVLDGKRGGGVLVAIIFASKKCVATAPGRVDGAAMAENEERVVVRQPVGEREIPERFLSLHVDEVIAFPSRLRRRVKATEQIQIAAVFAPNGVMRASSSGPHRAISPHAAR